MGVPVMAITTTTLPMIIAYHEENKSLYARWLRVYLVLYACEQYNDGQLSEENLHEYLDLSVGDGRQVVERAPELLGMHDEP